VKKVALEGRRKHARGVVSMEKERTVGVELCGYKKSSYPTFTSCCRHSKH